MPHAMLITNTGWSMFRHRGEQICDLVARGWEVSAVALYENDEVIDIHRLGAQPYELSCAGAGANIAKNLSYLAKLTLLIRRLKPDVVHVFSIKAGVWACLAARLVGVPRIVCTVTGGDYAIVSSRALAKRAATVLAKLAFSSSVRLIFQNNDDLAFFVRHGIVKRWQCRHVPGCGVDVGALIPNYHRARARFVMVSRMLWSKGLVPFTEAAWIVKNKYPEAVFFLVGGSKEDYGTQNSDFAPAMWLENFTLDGRGRWLGRVPPDEAERIMSTATAVVLLSSYNEGVPRVLIEAAALGSPIITTNMPGCRDVVDDKVSGYLCDVESPEQAAAAMIKLIENPDLVRKMGMAGRKMARPFDATRIMDATMEVYKDGPLSKMASDRGSYPSGIRLLRSHSRRAGHDSRHNLIGSP